jgi:hypothetical protein
MIRRGHEARTTVVEFLLGKVGAIKFCGHRRDDMPAVRKPRKTQLVYYCAVQPNVSANFRGLRKSCSLLQHLQLTFARRTPN